MHTGRATLAHLLAAVLLVSLTTCKMDLSVPRFSLEFRGTTAYPSPTAAIVEFRYSAEENLHRCRLQLTDSSGGSVGPGITEFFTAGEWHSYGCSLPSEGHYTFRVVVQVEKPSGEFVDLAFLDRSLDLFVDLQDPEAPTIDPTPAISSHPLAVTLQHPELDNPTGSPVSLYYTLDETSPGAGSPRYTGSPIVLPLSNTPKTLKVVAIDAADRASDPQTHSFAFMDVQSRTPHAISRLTPNQFIVLNGYGLAGIVQARLYDGDYQEGTSNGTGVSTAVMSADSDEVTIAVQLSTVVEPGSDGKFDAGTGCVKVTDGTGETDTIAIQITD